ncbi:ABC transporter ATP-binding protein [Candidatus Nitronereus thalassa]|uniref:ABC transporter ATP-binding protein n=1 Tax=Candidatus Nitronereus thalassa TaxID=3020898 RepID=A0ABU3K350_9BACT|nr:ABC transporter ATP-binding protein [Candidatus Nitronereus thalassa]MDT7040818.1 ABC transporter ATP-binding protein [Candidatus Nitronereus thalassa]
MTTTPTASPPIVLELHKVTCSYEPGRPAVQDISFAVQKGDIICLLGPSGCGKTTTLRAIAGFESVLEGSVRLDGKMVADGNHHVPPEQRRVGMVFQDYALFPHLCVNDNVGFGLNQLAAENRRRRVEEMLSLTGLSDFGRRYPHELSGGQQQRVALARALAPQPVLLLLDEPFSNLDPDMTYKMRGELHQVLKNTQTTAVLVTHDHEEAFTMADKVAVLHQGRLEQFASPETIYHLPNSRFVAEFVGQADFIPGEIHEHYVVTELGHLPLPNHYQGSEHVDVMIRPDDIKICGAESTGARIETRQFRGSENLYGIRLKSGRLIHSSESSTQIHAVGTQVALKIVVPHIVLFDRAQDS